VHANERKEDRLLGGQALTSPALYGCTGTQLTSDERRFFGDSKPLGFILFARNCVTGPQIRALVDDLHAAADQPDALVLIDQEGGRVARLKPPEFRAAPAAQVFGDLAVRDRKNAIEAARINARLIASELEPLGINVDCLPLLDVPAPGGHGIIGDRAFSSDPELVATLGAAAADGLKAGGVLPVIKHIPGHGRAGADSHLALPVVDASAEDLKRIDFAPFRAMNHLPLAMTAHVVYAALDPDQPATTSVSVIAQVIREDIGFDGLLMSDDLSMSALSGPVAARARGSLDAGCDVVLHCNGDMAEMVPIAEAVGETLTPDANRRAASALNALLPPEPFDRDEGRARLDELLAQD